MGKIRHVMRRGRIYYYQRRIPEAVKDREEDWVRYFGGQPVYRKSLETDDHAEALIAAAATEQEFNTLVRLIVTGQDDSLPVRTRSNLVTNRLLSPLDCQRIFRERRERITGRFYPLAMRAHVDRDAADELDDKTEQYLNNRKRFLESLDPSYRKRDDADEISPREWAEFHNERDGFVLPTDSMEFAKLVGVIKDALIQADRDVMHLIETGETLPPQVTGTLARLIDRQVETTASSSPISETVGRYKAKGGRRGPFPPKTLSAIDHTLALFTGIVGDKRLHEIDSDDVIQFVRERCSQVVGGRSADSIERPINRQTVQRDLSFLRSACALEISHGHFKGVNPIGMVNLDHFITAPDPRKMPKKRPMETGELQALLEHPWFSGCRSRTSVYAPGSHRLTDVRFWAPIVALFTGCRASELGGLRLDDLRLDDPFPHLVVRPNEYRGTKNSHERTVPILDELVRFGFVEYVEAVRTAGRGDRLFPDWEAPKRKGVEDQVDMRWANAKWCKAFNRTVIPHALEQFLVKGARRAITFHQTRGTFLTMLTVAKIPDRYVDQIVGHSAEGTRKHYQGGIPLAEIYPTVRAASYSSIDFTPLYRAKTKQL